jgi:hypothetical protein
MRKNFLMMALVSLFTVVAFSSCSKDEDNGNGDSSKIEDNKLTVAVEDGASYNSKIDLVKVEIGGDYSSDGVWSAHTVATAPYSNGGFTLNLPESVDARYLYDMDDEEGITVSNRSALIGTVRFAAYKSDARAGYIYCGTASGEWEAMLVYANADVSITGVSTETDNDEGRSFTYRQKYNAHLKRGWNMVYEKETVTGNVKDYEVTTTAPAGMKWYVGYYGNDNDDDDDDDDDDGNNDDGDDPNDGGSSEIESNKITVAVENGESYNSKVDLVKAEITYRNGDEWPTITVATAPYSNGGFTLNLPENVEERCLQPLFEGEVPGGVTVSNRDAKWETLNLGVYKSNSETGYIYCTNSANEWRGDIVYVDSDVSATGIYTEYDSEEKRTLKGIMDIHFKRGWNMMYNKVMVKNNVEEIELTTTVPEGMKWYIEYRGNDEISGSLPKKARALSAKHNSRRIETYNTVRPRNIIMKRQFDAARQGN